MTWPKVTKEGVLVRNEYENGTVYLRFYCAGCLIMHGIHVKAPLGGVPTWEWDGSVDKPTFSPSILVEGSGRCHSFVRNGEIEFLGDCSHTLKGMKFPLEPVPFKIP